MQDLVCITSTNSNTAKCPSKIAMFSAKLIEAHFTHSLCITTGVLDPQQSYAEHYYTPDRAHCDSLGYRLQGVSTPDYTTDPQSVHA